MRPTIGIIGGAGQFGSFVAAQIRDFDPKITVRSYDTGRETDWRCEEVITSDIVIFTVPPNDYENSLRELVPRMPRRSIIVDVCTVKVRTLRVLQEVADGRPYVSCHPMFGPQSFFDNGNTLKGLQLVLCEATLAPSAREAMMRLFHKLELRVVEMTADAHDDMEAIVQLLPQHVGCVVNRAGFSIAQIGVRTKAGEHFFRAMEIMAGDRELFRQASAMNPYWPKVLAQYELADAQHNLDMLQRD